jgi:hypothetical protein
MGFELPEPDVGEHWDSRSRSYDSILWVHRQDLLAKMFGICRPAANFRILRCRYRDWRRGPGIGPLRQGSSRDRHLQRHARPRVTSPRRQRLFQTGGCTRYTGRKRLL